MRILRQLSLLAMSDRKLALEAWLLMGKEHPLGFVCTWPRQTLYDVINTIERQNP